MNEPISWRVDPSQDGVRLDRHVALHLATARHQVQQWISDGAVLVDGNIGKAADRVRGGQTVTCSPAPPPALARPLTPESLPLDVVWSDEDLVVIDKPAGLAVHPGAGRTAGTLVHRLVSHYPEIAAVGGPGRPGLVHRLDKDTTGVLVVARTAQAYAALSTAFAARRVEKSYLAICFGEPRERRGEIEVPIGRHPQDRKKMAVVERGRPARSTWEALASAGGLSFLRVGIETGRTHQIRVHMKWIRHPLVGDPTYGEARWRALSEPARRLTRDFPRPALHAARLRLAHPRTQNPLTFDAPLPADMVRLWEEATQTQCPSLDVPRAGRSAN